MRMGHNSVPAPHIRVRDIPCIYTRMGQYAYRAEQIKARACLRRFR